MLKVKSEYLDTKYQYQLPLGCRIWGDFNFDQYFQENEISQW